MSSPASSKDSLFDDDQTAPYCEDITPAKLSAPIPGLYIFPTLLPHDVAQAALEAIAQADHFVGGARDQAMLFAGTSGLPSHIEALDTQLESLLKPHLPSEVAELAFHQNLARQVILNLYPPGTGISSHIDLPSRYADGIVGVSLTGGCVMTFERAAVDGSGYRTGGEVEGRHDVYIPPRSIYVLSGAARWEWAHCIPSREVDLVEDGSGVSTLPRSLRVSVTLRWLKDAVLS